MKILVIDTPKSCYDCQYCRFDARRYNFRGCVLTDTDVQDGTIDICKDVHSCCPLKPLPHKLQADWYTDGYKEGFNACLDEIVGETE